MESSTPEEQGIPAPAILRFLTAAQERIDSLHSLTLVRHGQVVADGWWAPYQADQPHQLYSLSKSFTSTAIGLAVHEGRLSVDDPVVSLLPGSVPSTVDDRLAAMRVRHLLTMSTGHSTQTLLGLYENPGLDWASTILALPISYEPGTHFVYNSGASYLLAAILHRLTGQTLLDYLRPRLLDPLGITGASWASCPAGINVGGWGLSLRTADIAAFGQLYLQDGVWQGQRLVPRDWVRAATAKQVPNDHHEGGPDWQQGYGYQFWRCRHNVYRGDGAFGQFCLVFPEQDAVLALTSGTPDLQGVLDLVWEHLLPALGDAPLPADNDAEKALTQHLSRLQLAPVTGSGKAGDGRAFRVRPARQPVDEAPTILRGWLREDVETIALAGSRLTINGQDLICPPGEWHYGSTPLFRGEDNPVATTGAWLSDDTYQAKICWYRTPFIRTLTLRYTGGGLALNISDNVSFGGTEHPTLQGDP